MNGWMSKIAGGSLVLLLLVAIFLGGYSSLLSLRLQLARQQAAEQKKTLAQQSGLISALQTQERKNRALATEQHRREQQLRQQNESYQRKYREAIKNDACAAQPMPVATIELLQQSAADTTANSPATP
ncbi:hypothetical protein ACMGF7_22005 [Serratia sp. BNK-17]|uniref:hypothetical protein n=1 Tax=Serratia sp. BNK-17 TaxID=3376154 RepID=UPI003B43797A